MDKSKIKNRLTKDKALLWAVCILATLTAVPLFAILGEVFLRGYDQLSFSFFTEPTPTAYKAMKAIEAGEPIPGGIANGIIGTMLMLRPHESPHFHPFRKRGFFYRARPTRKHLYGIE